MVTVDRHDPQAICQRSGCEHRRVRHTKAIEGGTWTACRACDCAEFNDGRPQPVEGVDNPRTDPQEPTLLLPGDVDAITDIAFARGWNSALTAAISLLDQYGHKVRVPQHGSPQALERARIRKQLADLER